MSTHQLAATPATTVNVFSRAHQPALMVESGDRVVVESLDAAGHLERQRVPGEDQPKMFSGRRGHCLTGPIGVRGARAGDLLAVHLVDLRTGSWGWTVAGAAESPVTRRLGLDTRDPSWLLWELDPETGLGTANGRFQRRLSPFLGVIGTAPAADGEHSTTPPRADCGGNIDCRELVAGSTLYLPVGVDDALLYLGDGHAAQGDGEVGGTAIECPMTTEVVVELTEPRVLSSVHAETPIGRITFGFDADLNAAMGDALDAMVTWMQQLLGVSKITALALASSAVDLRVTQVANQAWGVHAVLPKAVITTPRVTG